MSTPSPTSPPSPSAPPPSNATSPPPSSSPPSSFTSPPPAAPPPSNVTSPPPAAPPPSNSTSPPPAAPPPSTPSAPPPSTPSTPSAPPPSTPTTPSAPPPSTPSTPSAPPPSTPSIHSPPPSSTPSPPSARPPSTPSIPSAPPHSVPPTPKTPSVPRSPNSTTPSAPSPPAPRGGSPPSSSQDNSNAPISIGAAAGIATGAAAILAVLCFLFICCRKKRRRGQSPPVGYYGGGPPSMPSWKDDEYGTQPQYWQHDAPPPPPRADNIMKLPPQPSAAYSYASHPAEFLPSPPPPPNFSSGSGSGSYHSGSEPLPPLNPKYTPGNVKSTFTYEELAMATDGFSDYNLLGQGGFGYVHKGILPNGKEVAIKQLKAGSGQGEREFQAEVDIISRVHHRHLVSLVGYCISGDHRLLVYEYVPNKTLEFHLHEKSVPPMDWQTRLKIALGSAKGLAYLHEDCHPKIIHRDIKAANILLEMNFDAKVADFGLAKFTVENNTHVSTRVMGTFGYLAPEYASSGKLSDKSDVFSFGVMLLELITGKRPVDTTQTYIDDSLVEWARPLLQKAMEHDDYDELIDRRLGDKYNPDEMARMVACAASCVRHSARRRPKMSQIVRALEGHVSLEALNEGTRPGNSTAHESSYGSSDYDTMQYNEDLKKFRNIALVSRDYTSSDYSVPTSEYGQILSASSGENKQGQEVGGKGKKDVHGS